MMKSDVTTIIHLSKEPADREKYVRLGELLGIVILHVGSLEELYWVSSRLNRYLVLISDSEFATYQLDIDVPVICVKADGVGQLKSLLSQII